MSDASNESKPSSAPGTNSTPPAAPRRGLLVEDRNAFARTEADGRQTIVKTGDRAAEAARQGVSESSI